LSYQNTWKPIPYSSYLPSIFQHCPTGFPAFHQKGRAVGRREGYKKINKKNGKTKHVFHIGFGFSYVNKNPPGKDVKGISLIS
jgi:hypothetical protein